MQERFVMKILSHIIIIFVLIVGITFAVLNGEIVTFHYYLGSRQISLALLLAGSFGAGIFFTALLMSFITFRLKREKRKLRKKLKEAKQEIDNLRTIPIKELQ